MSDQNQPLTIEEFRTKINQDYLTKGIIPPAALSPEEQNLYSLYLKGWQIIHTSSNDSR